jgi:hypothetical protein
MLLTEEQRNQGDCAALTVAGVQLLTIAFRLFLQLQQSHSVTMASRRSRHICSRKGRQADRAREGQEHRLAAPDQSRAHTARTKTRQDRRIARSVVCLYADDERDGHVYHDLRNEYQLYVIQSM